MQQDGAAAAGICKSVLRLHRLLTAQPMQARDMQAWDRVRQGFQRELAM